MDALAPPRNRVLLEQYRTLCQLPAHGDPRQQLTALARAFSLLPYENLTKIVKHAESGSTASARRAPDEVLRDFQRWRAGGTCFSLTATLLHLIRALGLQAEPILADRRYGADTHCALLVWLDHLPHLLDPGYLIVDPVPLDITDPGRRLVTRFNQLQLVPGSSDRLELHTIEQENRRYRLTFKTSPVDAAQFQAAWDSSFDWDMMHYPLLTKVTEDQQLYMRGGHLQRRSPTDVRREDVPPEELAERIAREFNIHEEVIRKALAVLRRGSDRYGRDQPR